MKLRGKILRMAVLGASLALGVTVFSNSGLCATAPIVSDLTPVVEGISTPVRIISDTAGNYYVSDTRGGGILKYDKNGNLVTVFTAVHDAVGMAFASNGELLVTHGTNVNRLNVTTGAVTGTFGNFKHAHGIAVDAAGNIYVTDSEQDCVFKYTSAFSPVTITAATHDVTKPANTFGTTGVFAGQMKRPAGISYEKVSGQLAVADSLNGRINFYNADGSFVKSLGTFGISITGTPVRFTFPKSISFEYTGTPAVLSRYYVTDSYQSNIQVIDASTNGHLGFIGSYGYSQGNLVAPMDAYIDQSNSLTPVLVVTNENGMLTRYGIDSLQPYNVSVSAPTVPGQLTLNWTNPSVSTFKAARVFQSTVPNVLGTQVGADIAGAPGSAGSTTVTGLTPGVTYFYTVRGVNTATPAGVTSNMDQYSQTTLSNATLSVVVAGLGSGSINSDLPLPGLVKSGNTYTATALTSTKITLSATPDASSVFSGWSGAPCEVWGKNNCVFTLASNTSVTANFAKQSKFKINGRPIYADTLQEIYAQAQSGDTILVMAGDVDAHGALYTQMTANNDISIKLVGGYNSTYTAVTGTSTINGLVVISNGTVLFENISIK